MVSEFDPQAARVGVDTAYEGEMSGSLVTDDLGGGEVSQMLTAAMKQMRMLRESITALGHRLEGVRSKQDMAPKEVLSEAAMPTTSALGTFIGQLVDEIQSANRDVSGIRESIAL